MGEIAWGLFPPRSVAGSSSVLARSGGGQALALKRFAAKIIAGRHGYKIN